MFTCRVVEGKEIIQHILWCHPEAIIHQRCHAVVP